MTQYIVRRIFSTIPVLVFVAFMCFLLLHLSPGDAAIARLPVDATPQEIERLRVELGLDQPFLVQFVGWGTELLRGHLGYAHSLNLSVGTAIRQRLAPTVTLALSGFAVAIILGMPAGIIAAVKQNTYIDQFIMTTAVLGVSLPSFVMGLLLMLIFSLYLRILPSGGYAPLFEAPLQSLRYLALPSLAIGLFQGAIITRMTRSSMLEVLKQDYVRTARSKGVHEWIVTLRHAQRNALIPILTIAGMVLGSLLGGVVVIETVFTYPGLGRLAVHAIHGQDFPLVQGIVLFFTSTYVFINLLVDFTYALVDPRIRYD